jgi:hypothetical protein
MSADAVADTLETWLYSLLSGDETLKALFTGSPAIGQAPLPATASDGNQGDVRERVVFSNQSGLEDSDRCGSFAGARYVYAVKAVVPGKSFAAARALKSRIDALLRGVTATSDGLRFTIACEGTIRYPEPDPANQTWHVHSGGLYAFTVR